MIYERENCKNNSYYYSATAFGGGTDYHFTFKKDMRDSEIWHLLER